MPEDTKIPSGERKGPEGEIPHNMKLYLEVLEGPEAGKKFQLTRLTTSLGRKNCEIILNDPTISSKHATIEVTREDIMIYDQNSTNGTFVNGEQISSCPLQNLDEIKLGETRLLFSIASDPYAIYHEAGSEEMEKTPVMDEQTRVLGEGLFNPELPEEFHAALMVEEGPNKGQHFRLRLRSTVIGRKGAELILDDDSVSQRHAQIEIHSKDKITIKDLASKNGTRVNNVLVSAVKIRNGDVIQLGKTRMTFYFRVNK